MALKKSLLSKLFNAESNSHEEEVDQAEIPVSKPAGREPLVLELPSNHAFHQLRKLWSGRTGKHPPEELCFALPPDVEELMTESEEKREILRLKAAVTTVADKRLGAVRIRKKAEDGTETETEADLDALAEVFLSGDCMSVWLLVYPPTGAGREVSQEMLRRVLQENEVRFGINETLLETLPAAGNRYFTLFLAARGTKPVHGEDGFVEELFPRIVHRAVVIDEFGQADYTASNWVQNIEKGEAICRITYPTEGTPGRTVLDKELPAQPGKAASIPQGRNTMLSEGGGELIAVQSGQVEFSGHNFQVNPVLYIEGDVDYSTGNVDFWGDVHVGGNVCNGFTVRATGMVTVDGIVESCNIEAGTDLIVRQGVQGNKQAMLKAHRNIYAKFLENCNVYARENLQADCILNCNVYANGSVRVTSGRGIIIGGRLQVAQEVKARTVGSKSEVATIISLGGAPYEDFEYASLSREVDELEENLKKLILQPDSRVRNSQIVKLKVKLISDRNRLKNYKEEIELLKEEAKKSQEQEQGQDEGQGQNQNQNQGQKQEQESGRLVCDTAYSGTVIVFGELMLRLRETVTKCKAMLVDGEIRLQ